MPGYASLIVSVMFFSGMQLMSLGIIGEYIGRIFAEVKRRPLYVVAERVGAAAGGERRARAATTAGLRAGLTACSGSILSVGGWTLVSRAHGLRPRHRHGGRAWAPGPSPTPSWSRCACPTISAPSSAKARSTPPSCPTYARVLETDGGPAARRFASRIFTLMLLVQIVAARRWRFVGDAAGSCALLAPGFSDDPAKFELAVTLTRITFPYLLFITLVTLLSGVLNAHERFAAAGGGARSC